MIATDDNTPPVPDPAQARAPLNIPPIESHIVGAALSIEKLRQGVLLLAYCLQHQPRDATAIKFNFGDAQSLLTAAWEHYAAYDAVRGCEGSA